MQQAITWANVDPDLCRHMVSLGYIELICECPVTPYGIMNLVNIVTHWQ